MKRYILVILALSTITIAAQSPQFNLTQYRTAFAKETLTVAATSVSLTAAVYNPTCTNAIPTTCRAEVARIICKDNGAGATETLVSYWEDGSTPTASVGNILSPGDALTLRGYKSIQNFKFIRSAANSVVCNVIYYRFASN